MKSIETLITDLIAALVANTEEMRLIRTGLPVVGATTGKPAARGSVKSATGEPLKMALAPVVEEPDAIEITKEMISKRVTALQLKRGREVTIKALADVGAKNASGIKPEDYAAFIANTDILLADGAE